MSGRSAWPLLALLVPLAAAAGVRPRYGGELRVVLPSAPVELDPAQATSPSDLVAVRAVHATLLEVDALGQLHPALLEAVPAPEEGGRAFTLRLAPGLRFQDGRPLGAAEVAASLARAAGPRSANAWVAAAIEGSAEVREGKARLLSGVRVLSARELRIALSYPFPEFPQALATLPSAIVSPGPDGAPVGAGPFRPVGVAHGELQLAPFDGFGGGRPFLDALALATAGDPARALDGGRAGAVLRPELLGPLRAGAAGSVGSTGPWCAVLAVVSRRLGASVEPTRAALGALDRADLSRLVRAVVGPLGGLLPPPMLSDGVGRAAPARAPGALPGRLELLVPKGDDALRAAAARIQVKLYDRGVRVAVESAPAPVFAARLASGAFDAALVPVWLAARTPALALAQVATALGGRERGALALARAAAAAPGELPGVAAGLEAELMAVPLFTQGLRFVARDGVQGASLRRDGTLDAANAWLMPQPGRAP